MSSIDKINTVAGLEARIPLGFQTPDQRFEDRPVLRTIDDTRGFGLRMNGCKFLRWGACKDPPE